MIEFTLHGNIWETNVEVDGMNSPVSVLILRERDLAPTTRQVAILQKVSNLCVFMREKFERCAASMLDDDSTSTPQISLRSALIPELMDCNTGYIFFNFDCIFDEEYGMQILTADEEIVIFGKSTSLPFSQLWIHAIELPTRTEQLKYLRSLDIY